MSLSAFLAENALPIENQKVIVSERFVENGKPIPWEVKAISSEEDELLRKESTTRKPISGRAGQYETVFDANKYMAKLCVECTVFPDLYSDDLMKSYKVGSPQALIKAMLSPGEYMNYVSKVQDICGFNVTLQDEVDEAKN